ncbi:hypothetical protein [Nocardioides sp.]|uniref:hypothetical protein n=1 Tax=Nocardioides sp. TaxID=35761 RepID=UPI0019B0557A|nr:hypothetical protein [Nocardioides sp.]MBC7279751.1 hypothetical protein [Nocardioides sp.]
MIITNTAGRRRARTLSLATLAAVGLFALAGCGSDSDAASDQQRQESGQGQQQDRRMDGGMPGATGEIAAIDGSTLQVQGSDSQTAVTYNDETTISQQVSTALSDVTVGSCVTVTPAEGAESSETTVTASVVRITEKTDGSCAGGGSPGGRPRPEGGASGAPERTPAEMPEGMPSGGPGGFGDGPRGGLSTSGEVTAVSGSGFTMAATSRRSEETTSVNAAVGPETSYTTTETATKSALVIGKCVTASGESDDTGAVTAERISITEPVDGGCAAGFRGRGGMPGGAPGQNGASS